MADGDLGALVAKGAPLHVLACPNPFQQCREEYSLIPGQSLLEILREIQPDIHFYHAHVWVGEHYIPESEWAATYPPPGSEITIRVAPRGEVGRMIGFIFIAIAAIAITVISAGTLGPEGFAMMSAGWAWAVGGIIGMAVSIVGQMVINALIPPTANPGRQNQLQGTSSLTSPSWYALGAGTNNTNLFGPVTKVMGRNKYMPPYGARTYTEIVGAYQYLRCLFVWGFGPVQLEDLKIGSTPLANFQGVQVEHRNLTLLLKAQDIAIDVSARTLTRSTDAQFNDGIGVGSTLILGGCTTPANNTSYVITAVSQSEAYGPTPEVAGWVTTQVLSFAANTATTTEPGNGAQTIAQVFGNDPLTLYTEDIQEDPLAIELLINAPVIQTSELNPDELSIDITWPDGLRGMNAATGETLAYGCTFSIYYRQTGTNGPWLTPSATDINGNAIGGTISFGGNTSSAVYFGANWPVDRPDPTLGPASYDVMVTRTSPGPDDIWHESISYWTALRTIIYKNPLNFPVPLAMTVVRIQASYQLQGTLNNFNGIVTGIYRDWDKDTQTWILRPTSNPASLALEWLTGPHKQRPYLDSMLDMASFAKWHEYCQDPDHYNG